MRNQKRWIGIAALTGVTVIALAAGIIIKKNLSGDPAEVISITEEGTNLGLTQIETIKDGNGTITGYKATIETKGFGEEPIVMAVSFNAAADEVTGLEIISHSETDGLGSKITEEAFLSQFAGVKLPVLIEGMTVATSEKTESTETIQETTTQTGTEEALIDGTYEVVGEPASNGYTSHVSLTVAGGKITEVVWDCVDAEGNKKSVQSMNGEYVMTEGGPTWAAQAEALATYVVENQGVNTIVMNDEGKTDTVASVSISVNEFVSQVRECLDIASGKAVQSAVTLKDGTYQVVGEPASNGYTSEVSLTVAGGKITEVVWDCVDAEGNKKSVQSMNGEYVMTENGPTWAAQAEALAAYVVENQGVDTIALNDEGKTDTVASVSISVGEFVNQVKECLDIASGKEVQKAAALKDGTYEVVGEPASNGYTSQVSLTVAGGKITEVVWDCVDAEGNKKSVQSMNGEYVMTENGPTWAAQAEALAAYVVENQGVDTIALNDEGKTDTIASVSISVGEFVAQVKECLEQAAETEAPVSLNLNDGTYNATGETASNGYTSEVSVTVEGGVITSVVWDAVNADGAKKSVQSMNGEYVMTENGPTWAAQAEALAAFVVEHQGVSEITMNDEGKTDAVASVSINVSDFVSLVQDCLTQAAGTVSEDAETSTETTPAPTEEAEAETAVDGTMVDAISGATVSTKAVLNAINNAADYLQRYVVE